MNRSKSQQATHRATLRTLPSRCDGRQRSNKGSYYSVLMSLWGRKGTSGTQNNFNLLRSKTEWQLQEWVFISLAPVHWLQLIAQLKDWLPDCLTELTLPTFSHAWWWWFGPLMVPTRASDGPNFPDCHPIKCQGRPIRRWESFLCLLVTVGSFTWLLPAALCYLKHITSSY